MDCSYAAVGEGGVHLAAGIGYHKAAGVEEEVAHPNIQIQNVLLRQTHQGGPYVSPKHSAMDSATGYAHGELAWHGQHCGPNFLFGHAGHIRCSLALEVVGHTLPSLFDKGNLPAAVVLVALRPD